MANGKTREFVHKHGLAILLAALALVLFLLFGGYLTGE